MSPRVRQSIVALFLSTGAAVPAIAQANHPIEAVDSSDVPMLHMAVDTGWVQKLDKDSAPVQATKRPPLIRTGQTIRIVFEQTEGHKAFAAVALDSAVYLGDKLMVRVPDGRTFKARAASKTVVHLILPQ